MPVRSAWRSRALPAMVSAAAGLALTGAAALQPAQAAPAAPSVPAVPLLSTSAPIALGATTSPLSSVFTQAPDGTVFYSIGTVVYAQAGISPPKVALSSTTPALALAANTSYLFVETGLTVTEYSRTSGAAVRHWTLTSPVRPVTFAGLLSVGKTLWSWTDWGTDSSGFEFARLSRIVITGSTVYVVDKRAYPADMAADHTGLYYQDARGAANTGYLVHVTPAGVVSSNPGPVDWPMALSGGQLEELGHHVDGYQYLDTYSPASLTLTESARVSSNDRDIAGSYLGLTVLTEACTKLACPKAHVSLLAAGGFRNGTVLVPNAFTLLTGPTAAAVVYSAGKLYLVRLGD